MTDKPKKNKPTKAQLERFVELRAKKRELDAQIRAIESEMYTVHEACVEYLEDKGVASAKLHRFTISLNDGQTIVKWKDEFIAVAGAEKAAEISASAPRAKRLEVVAPTENP
ncbi:MAG: hypothetical protein U0930_03615 [Pirellulales bacterium]